MLATKKTLPKAQHKSLQRSTLKLPAYTARSVYSSYYGSWCGNSEDTVNAQEHSVLNLFTNVTSNTPLNKRESFWQMDTLSTSAHNRVKRGWAGYNKVTVHWAQAAILTQQRKPGDEQCSMDSVTTKIQSSKFVL